MKGTVGIKCMKGTVGIECIRVHREYREYRKYREYRVYRVRISYTCSAVVFDDSANGTLLFGLASVASAEEAGRVAVTLAVTLAVTKERSLGASLIVTASRRLRVMPPIRAATRRLFESRSTFALCR